MMEDKVEVKNQKTVKVSEFPIQSTEKSESGNPVIFQETPYSETGSKLPLISEPETNPNPKPMQHTPSDPAVYRGSTPAEIKQYLKLKGLEKK